MDVLEKATENNNYDEQLEKKTEKVPENKNWNDPLKVIRETQKAIKKDNFEKLIKILKIKIIDLSDQETRRVWQSFISETKAKINEELKLFKANFEHIKIDLFDLDMTRSIGDKIKDGADKLEAYRKENPNNLEKFKKYFDPLLNRFHLVLDTSINFENIDEEYFIKIKSKQGDSIPINNWSTGLRQLIYNILPLYAIETGEDTLILIDEPERSLYPNTQKILIDFYTGISPKSQFIFATHSPIIAAQFEPWEIIDLRFNENGKVERKLYYDLEKGNHVDNYFIHPKYLRWDSLFELMFGLEEESNPERTKKLEELAILDRKIKKEPNKEKKKEMWQDYQKLASLLDWKTNGSLKTDLAINAKN